MKGWLRTGLLALLAGLACGEPEPEASDEPWLFYTRHPVGGGTIEVVATQLGTHRTVVLAEAGTRQPWLTVSPTGHAVAIWREREDGFELEVVEVSDAGAVERHAASSNYPHEVAWSDDGRFVAWADGGRRGDERTGILDLETGERREVAIATFPLLWEPGGHLLAGMCSPGTEAICIADLDALSASLRRVPVPAGVDQILLSVGRASPWSADGRLLAFIGQSEALAPEIFVFDTETAAVSRIGSWAHQPRAPWFPAPGILAFADADPTSSEALGGLYFVELEGVERASGPHRLTHERAEILWLGGDTVVSYFHHDAGLSVATLTVDGGTVTRTGGFESTDPCFSASSGAAVHRSTGALVAACGEALGSELEILRWDPSMSEPTVVGKSPVPPDPRGWTPDGSTFVFIAAEDRRSGPLLEIAGAAGEVRRVRDDARLWPWNARSNQIGSPWTPAGDGYLVELRDGGLIVRYPETDRTEVIVENDGRWSLSIAGFGRPGGTRGWR